RDADMLQRAGLIVESKEQRAHGVVSALVPAESGDHAVGGARVLDLDHRALARCVGTLLRFRHDPVEARTLEAGEPLGGDRSVARGRCQVEGWCHACEQALQFLSTLVLRRATKI